MIFGEDDSQPAPPDGDGTSSPPAGDRRPKLKGVK
jgi:hypothetical protein